MKHIILLVLILLFSFAYSRTVEDIDGNVYNTVRIGRQVWTVENWRSTKYADGTPIPHVIDGHEWRGLSTPAYCFIDNTTNADSIALFGALYNWWVVDPANPKNIAPEGWRVPTDEDWTVLEKFLIAKRNKWYGTNEGNKIGKALSSDGGEWWDAFKTGRVGNDQDSNNSSGFSALPGGYRGIYGGFFGVGGNGYWWSATESGGTTGTDRRESPIRFIARNRSLDYFVESLNSYYSNRGSGLSVRLIRGN